MAQAFNVGKVAHHNGKRLVAAAFAAAKLGYRLLVGGVACQVKSAQTLDGDDTAVGQQLNTAIDNASLVSRVVPTAGDAAASPGSSPTLASRHMICGPQSKQASGCA